MENIINILLLILSLSSIFLSYTSYRKLKERKKLDKKLRYFLDEEIKSRNIDIDSISSLVKANSLVITIEKELDERDILEFKNEIETAIESAIERLANSEQIIIKRSIKNSNKDRYKHKVLSDYIDGLKSA